ncbi:unnamed protein product [Owenia fusiformis]|uniref:Uncharacterized protein n=1 Tax=Owenia fusiformis TaxID=6347 RepID=A0A8S4NE78_OWEFU|nr:unnamed protein product [Owenia fusiformis]
MGYCLVRRKIILISIIWIFSMLLFPMINRATSTSTKAIFERENHTYFANKLLQDKIHLRKVSTRSDGNQSFIKYTRIESVSTDVISHFKNQTVLRTKNTNKEILHVCKCGCCQQKGKSVTIVTALFDIGRKRWPSYERTYQEYLTFAQNVLKLDVNLVFYVEEKGRYFVERHRQGKEHKTEVILTELNNFTFYHYLSQMETVMGSKEFKSNHEQLNNPEGFSPLYNFLMSAKFFIMYETTLRNTFHSDYFFWMDAGYGHGNSDIFPPEDCPWAPCNILNNTISYVKLEPVDIYKPDINRLYKMAVAPVISGGFFGGSKKAIQNFYKLYKDVLEDWLKNGRIDDDQTVALACYFKRPSLFNLVPGGWDDVFKLFR